MAALEEDGNHNLDSHAKGRACSPGQTCHKQVLFPGGIGPPENRQTHACAGAKTRHQAGKAEGSFQIHLGQQNAGRTVGNQPYRRCKHRLEKAHPAQGVRDDLLPDPLHQQAENQAEQEDEEEDFQGVAECRPPERMLVAPFLMGFVAVHLVGSRGRRTKSSTNPKMIA